MLEVGLVVWSPPMSSVPFWTAPLQISEGSSMVAHQVSSPFAHFLFAVCKTQVSNVYSRYTSLHFWRAYESELSLSWFLTHMSHPASLIKLPHWSCCLTTFFCQYLECVTGGQWLLPAGASSLSPGAQSPLSGSMTARGTPPSGSMTARGTPRGLRSEPSAFGYGNTTPSGSSTSRATTPKFSTTPSRPTSATKSATQSRYHSA